MSEGKTFLSKTFFALVLLGAVACITPSFGQTFSISGRSANPGYFANRDGSLTVSYTVNLSGGFSLANVVPYLEQPTCATYGNRRIFNITYPGFGSSLDNLSQTDIPSWTNNTTQTVWFNVHMFDNSIMCPSTAAAELGSDCLTFDLLFSFSGNDQRVPVGLDQSQLLAYTNPPTDGVRVVDVLWDTNPAPRVEGWCQNYDDDFEVLVDDRGVIAAQVANDNNRIYYGVNWSLNIDTPRGQFDWRGALSTIKIPLSDDFQKLDLGLAIFEGRVDLIPQETRIVREDQTTFPLAAMGGFGNQYNAPECDLESYNFWDITDLAHRTGTVRDNVGSITQFRTVEVEKFSFNISYRSSALYLVNLNGCTSSSAFGTDQGAESMTFTRYQLDDQGVASVTVEVPASLKSGGDLADGYTVKWFARTNENYEAVNLVGGGPPDPQALSTTLQVPITAADATEIIAQITHTASNSVISIVSPGHGLTYQQLAAPQFLDNEVVDDGRFQVGESAMQNLVFTNNTGFDLTDVTFTLSAEGGSPAQFGFGTTLTGIQGQSCSIARSVFTTNLVSGQRFSIDLLVKKLYETGVCNANNNYRFALTTAYELNNVTHSYAQHFELTPGCTDDNPHGIDMDGLVTYWGTCPTGGIRLPIFGDSIYSYRWFDSAASLCLNTWEDGVDTDFWSVPDLTQTGDVYVEVTDFQTGLKRIYPLRVIVFDNLPTQAELLPSWREETITDVDLDNDGLVTALDAVIFYSAGGCQ
ncbi:hypothetical protein [Acanthopleuribacter pedis]|uniref:Uncharacterized protein n=1 Tax=Acanthopleuribacter pedis TaxID=442870 RepID=A0A8J7Q6N4_9BACT|nr:hypothetical protein [Acanthopleuribacter pedis]MBO1317719.1 hypothetical protein [Acanthopleuribacter pedis]